MTDAKAAPARSKAAERETKMWYSKNDLYWVVELVGRLPVEYDTEGNGRYDLSSRERMTLAKFNIWTIDK